LVLRSFISLTHVEVGFDARNLYLARFDLPDSQCSKLQECAQFIGRIERSIAAIPGIESASISLAAPFGHEYNGTFATPAHSATPKIHLTYDVIGTSFFRALRAPLLRGREFTANDRAGSMPVAIVNATFARKMFGSLGVVGKQIVPEASFSGPTFPVLTIVGVARDMRTTYNAPADPVAYAPYMQLPAAEQIVIRTRGNAPAVAANVEAAFSKAAPSLAPPTLVSYDELLAQDALQSQASTMLFGVLALVALALAMCGVFAVSLYSVEQRTREFGIRRALGAETMTVVRDVIQRAGVHGVAGIVLGLTAAALLTRFLQSQLFETSPLDATTFFGVTLLIIGCTFVASLVPALRAARVDPAVALRYE
jgi:putative ABC transport system permease protein